MLSADHLTKRFGERLAVEDVTFELAPGEILALLGPNGAGKTTTLRMLGGLVEPTAGTVRIGGDRLASDTAPRLRGRIGFLTEAPGLWERLTVFQNLLVYARLQGVPSPRAAVDRALEQFDIRDRAAEPAARLSKGLKQRVALARTLLHQPPIVLLDEPTSGLDPESARDVRTLVLRLRDERCAVLVSTHNLDEMERVATRVAVLRTSLVAMDTPDALRGRLFGARLRVVLSAPAAPYAPALRMLGVEDVEIDGAVMSIGLADGSVAAPAVVRQLVMAGAGVEAVAREEPPLEEVYLRLLQS